ncbi:MAG: HlyD family secretion protein, partial [Rhodoferax sp.]
RSLSMKQVTARACLAHARPALALAVLLGASACTEAPAPGWSGYAEGDYLYIAAPLAGRLEALAVRSGDTIDANAPLFTLEAQAEWAAREEAVARLGNARAQAANADKGRRAEEIAVTAAQLAQAQASAALARGEHARQQQLLSQGFVSRARVDDADLVLRQAQHRVTELQAALLVAKLPARPDERNASQANVRAAEQSLRQTEWKTTQKQQRAPTGALVSDVFFREGEFVGAGQPVLALLPPENIKLRFFVAEAELARIAPGQRVAVRCDGCSETIIATVSRIASQAEYTPPVIFSNAQRAKLVFMVEARPQASQARLLHPGQPLDVQPALSGSTP